MNTAQQTTPISKNTKDVSPIMQLTNEMAAQIDNLRENIMSLNETFSGVLQCEDVLQCEEAEKACNEVNTAQMAPLVHWLQTQLMAIAYCNDRILNYKKRCQL